MKPGLVPGAPFFRPDSFTVFRVLDGKPEEILHYKVAYRPPFMIAAYCERSGAIYSDIWVRERMPVSQGK
jgi:hypothetical protein